MSRSSMDDEQGTRPPPRLRLPRAWSAAWAEWRSSRQPMTIVPQCLAVPHVRLLPVCPVTNCHYWKYIITITMIILICEVGAPDDSAGDREMARLRQLPHLSLRIRAAAGPELTPIPTPPPGRMQKWTRAAGYGMHTSQKTT